MAFNLNDLLAEEAKIAEPYDFDESCETAAKNLGMQVVTPAKNELFIDIDSDEAYRNCKRRIRDFRAMYNLSVKDHPSKSGLPHRHVYISLFDKLDNSPVELNSVLRICLQFAFGSDNIRETLSLYRHLSGIKDPTRFFEPKENQNE